jgi:hypothetical protein
MIPAAAFPKIEAGLAVPHTEEQVETFGERTTSAVQVAAKFIKAAVKKVRPGLPAGFGRA